MAADDLHRTRRAPHARAHGCPRHHLLPSGSRRGGLPAGTRRRYLRHDRRDSMSLGGHVPRPPDNRRCDPNGLRRPDHRHLRQKFPNRTVQGRPESRGRVPLRQNGRNAPHRARKRRKIPGQLGRGPEDGLLYRPALQPRTGTPLRPRTHGPQYLLLHGRIFGICSCGRSTRSMLDRLLGAGRRPGRRQRSAQLRRRGSPHFAGRRCRRIPQGHRRTGTT